MTRYQREYGPVIWTREMEMRAAALWALEELLHGMQRRPPGLERFVPGHSVTIGDVDGQPRLIARDLTGWTLSGWPVHLEGNTTVTAPMPSMSAAGQLDLAIETAVGAPPGADANGDEGDPSEPRPRFCLIAQAAVAAERPPENRFRLDLGRFDAERLEHVVMPRLSRFDAVRPWPATAQDYVATLKEALARLQAELDRPRGSWDWADVVFAHKAADVLLGWHRWPVAELVERLKDLGRLRGHRPNGKLFEPSRDDPDEWLSVPPEKLPAHLARLVDGSLPPAGEHAFPLRVGDVPAGAGKGGRPTFDLTVGEDDNGTLLRFQVPLQEGRLQLRFEAPGPGSTGGLFGPELASDMTACQLNPLALESKAFVPDLKGSYLLTPRLPSRTYWWVPRGKESKNGA
jgi:hypothetical protein